MTYECVSIRFIKELQYFLYIKSILMKFFSASIMNVFNYKLFIVKNIFFCFQIFNAKKGGYLGYAEIFILSFFVFRFFYN